MYCPVDSWIFQLGVGFYRIDESLASKVREMSAAKEKVLNITRLFNHGPSPFRTCQWPYGEPGTKEFRFCGEQTLEGYSYCPKHVEMAYREPEPRRKVA